MERRRGGGGADGEEEEAGRGGGTTHHGWGGEISKKSLTITIEAPRIMKIMVFAFMDIKRERPAVGSVRPQPAERRPRYSAAPSAGRIALAARTLRCGGGRRGGAEPPAHTAHRALPRAGDAAGSRALPALWFYNSKDGCDR